MMSGEYGILEANVLCSLLRDGFPLVGDLPQPRILEPITSDLPKSLQDLLQRGVRANELVYSLCARRALIWI